MTEDRRAHTRLDLIEADLAQHKKEHDKFEKAIEAIASNTDEIVQLVRGAKGLRSFVIWAAPLVAAILATWAWMKGH